MKKTIAEKFIAMHEKVFEHPNMNGFKCPICGTSADAPVVLVPYKETDSEYLYEAIQVHHKCWLLIKEMQELDTDGV